MEKISRVECKVRWSHIFSDYRVYIILSATENLDMVSSSTLELQLCSFKTENGRAHMKLKSCVAVGHHYLKCIIQKKNKLFCSDSLKEIVCLLAYIPTNTEIENITQSQNTPTSLDVVSACVLFSIWRTTAI